MIHALTFAVYTVTLDGKTVLPRARAAVTDGHVLLPVRALGEALGADVAYDGRAHTITIQRGPRVSTIPARGAVMIVNAKAYAPLRAVAETFGLQVAYDGGSRTVALNDGPALPVVREVQPTGQPYTQPATFTVSMQPAPNSEVHDPYPAVSARFAGAASIDPRSLHVLLDGRDVTPEAAVIGDQVLFTPRRALAPGTHDVTITGRDATGTPIAQSWSFGDTFTFAPAAVAPTPYPIGAIWLDRWVTAGTNAFDVWVQGAPGITGYVGVDGVGGIFPLQVYSADAYVAHVFVPFGVYQPYARVAARLTLPNGQTQTIVLPQRITLLTKPLGNATYPPAPTPTPVPRVIPPRRSVDVPTPTPLPSPTRVPLRIPLRIPTTAPTAVPSVAPAATPAPVATPTPVRTRKPIIRRTAPPSPVPAAT